VHAASRAENRRECLETLIRVREVVEHTVAVDYVKPPSTTAAPTFTLTRVPLAPFVPLVSVHSVHCRFYPEAHKSLRIVQVQ
jgi:hypothetical protein